ncbi:MAG TPA: LPS export ABC transporter periplasmic protein LptC [Ramlibacter sp.]|uniref:LPS export ABC transporter periplasmic protein LptC n=1 Tax=Ramlibacter sp. TaxID=1917967 RepID=UPI002C176317|nr:LPS export ABC transporter periplasmic protein LptC [Ramlibacter sp.]HVZ46944.1 LPS export ABC transporter periplasmic protein LptC [Ramlibacter sp.]
MPARLWRAWDRATVYLPLILMGVMALGTYWLARNTPSFNVPGVQRPPTHEPDYFMRAFSVKSFDAAGRLKSEVRGAQARHYPDSDTLEIDQPRIRSFGQDGQLTIATAARALSNADGSEVQLFGDAVVTRAPLAKSGAADLPPLEIRSDFLDVLVQKEEVHTRKPVMLRRGSDEFRADALDYNHLDRVLELRGNVRGTIAPHGEKVLP